ncbi:MAG: FkbM family methyltransferase [Alphaproteobacteria bacterium]|nr:FkbM family methyltransferase [Alphaproteobacteria bacterium]
MNKEPKRTSFILSWFGQALIDAIIHNSGGRLLARLGGMVAARLRSWMLYFDPLVYIDVCGHKLIAPLSHNLPIYQALFPHYDTALPRLCRLVAERRRGCVIVDIGANIGDTAASLVSVPGVSVVSIEGDERYFQLLSANTRNWKNVLAIRAFVAQHSGVVEGQLHRVAGTAGLRSDGQTASIHGENLEDILDRVDVHDAIDIIKIDTDGYDINIIRGALDMIARKKPVIFFEYDQDLFLPHTADGAHIFADMLLIWYRMAVVYQNTGEYLLSFDLGDVRIIEDISLYYAIQTTQPYSDICVFPAEKTDLFERFRDEEFQYFSHFSRLKPQA